MPRRMITKILSPLEAFLKLESAGGLLLLATALLAFVWANSPWAVSYEHLLHLPISFSVGNFNFSTHFQHWVNDALMVVFFFVVGMEIKYEFLAGELSSRKKAALPIWAAFGGMLVPVFIYFLFNWGGEHQRGWGIPMATDIAFALAVLALFSRRAPFALKVLLLALAIVDDLGAVLVIALFYTQNIQAVFLLVAFAIVAALYILLKWRLMPPLVFTLLAAVLWFCVLQSGVHTTCAGVVLGFLIPLQKHKDDEDVHHLHTQHKGGHVLSPLKYLIHLLHPWVSFFVMPLFALANAGVPVDLEQMGHIIWHPVVLGVGLGLAIGKPLGVVGFSWLAVRLKWAELPSGVRWSHMWALGVLSGIGFTMALFIGHLALGQNGSAEPVSAEVLAKVGILVASIFATAVGAGALYFSPKSPS